MTIEPIEQKIRVSCNYTVYFGSDTFLPENPLLKDLIAGNQGDLPGKLLFIIDEGVSRHHPQLSDAIRAYCGYHAPAMLLCGNPVVSAGGEQIKNDPRAVPGVQKAICGAGLCRHSYVVVIGGGALIDMVGFAAATVHRGVRLIRIPTTTLAQADGALGVKNGINAFGRKNFIGTFAPPWAVINDSSFLASLSDRDWMCGVAEALKVALIKDAAFFNFISEHADALRRRDGTVMETVIHRSAVLHLDHIAAGGDPFESGSSRPLDFGHWSAHKLEQISDYRLRHGEAVAVGIALDSTYSCLSGLLGQTQRQRILQTLIRLGFRLSVPELARPDDILEGINEFREHLGGGLTVMLLGEIGRGMEVHSLERKRMAAAIEHLKNLESGKRA
jgi:3-dehydroquinate synthase